MEILGLALLGIVLVVFGLQFWMGRRMKGLEGKAVPVDGAERAGRQLYYFFSPSCGPCRSMSPVIDELGQSHNGVIKVDVSEDCETARRFGVMGTPSLVLVNDGVVAKVLVGAQPRKRLESLLAEGE